MSRSLPPVPPENRSKKGPAPVKDKNVQGKESHTPPPKDLKNEGQAGNTFQNTHHQGHQQDR